MSKHDINPMELLVVQCQELANWINREWKGVKWWTALCKRWGVEQADLLGFIEGSRELSGSVIAMISHDTAIPIEKLAVDAQTAATLKVRPSLSKTPDDKHCIPVGVRLTDQARRYYKPEDFTPDGIHIRMMPEADMSVRVMGSGPLAWFPTGLALELPPACVAHVGGADLTGGRQFRGGNTLWVQSKDSYAGIVKGGNRVGLLLVYENRPLLLTITNMRKKS